jgi:hypothetical protein
MATSILAFNEHLADAARWSTRSASVTGGGGTTTAALPLTNIFTRNPAQVWERTGISDSDTVIVDLSLNDATSPTPLLGNAGALWGLLNCHAVRESTGELLDLRVRLRESAAAFTGPYLLDKTHVIYLREFQNAAARQTWFLRDGSTPMDAWTSSGFQSRGGNLTQSFVRIEFSMPTALGTWTLRTGRLARMSGLVCKIDRRPQREGFDASEVVRSFSGFPYVLAGARGRRYSGQAIALTDRQVDGVFFAENSTTWFRPSVNTIARVAGRSSEVCVVERAAVPDASSRWQQQPVFGLFDQDIVSSRQDNTDTSEGLSTMDFTIVESPQF